MFPPRLPEERRARFMAAQAAISARRLAVKVGRTLTVLVDEVTDGVAIARSHADAPEIDGVVRIEDGGALVPGTFVRVTIARADAHDVAGRLAHT